MEKFDKNYIIGFVLLFAMYGSYMYFYPPVASEPVENNTIETVQADQTVISQNPETTTTVAIDTALIKAQYGNFASAVSGEEEIVFLENNELLISLSSKGGSLKKVTLKNHRTYDNFRDGIDEPMSLIDEESSKIDLEIVTPSGKVNLSNLYFEIQNHDSRSVTFKIPLAEGKSIIQTYTLEENGFALDYDLQFENTAGIVNNEAVNLTWQNKIKKLENDLTENRKASQINYYEIDGDFEDIGYQSEGDEIEQAESPINWFTFKQKYFTTGLVSKNDPFQNFSMSLLTPTNDTSIVKSATIKTQISMAGLNSGKGNFRFYFGPNDLNELREVAEGFQQNLYLGYDIVKPINRYIFVPVFNYLEQFFTNYGLLIMALVILLKLVLSPLLYKSYVSSAKMRVLAPEIAEIKERVGDDATKVQQETMKLYQQVGVSPLSGCIPMVLQMPILMSVFFLFPNMEMFRQKGFLWASDLSTYDAPISWATNLPIIGNHLSLFVVLMTISSLAFTYYNNQITPTQPGPVDMKKISYIFPLIFFFVLNSFPAALSFYYLVSNLVTIAQQLTIKRFIDEDKILATLAENKKNYATKPKKKNKFADYMQKQLKAQEEANRLKAADIKKRKNKK